jgi:hypothetical protein
MKTRFVVAIGIMAAFCTGCMIGLLINYHSVNNSELAGMATNSMLSVFYTDKSADLSRDVENSAIGFTRDRNLNYIQPIKQY